jgi:hypothetical protein
MNCLEGIVYEYIKGMYGGSLWFELYSVAEVLNGNQALAGSNEESP